MNCFILLLTVLSRNSHMWPVGRVVQECQPLESKPGDQQRCFQGYVATKPTQWLPCPAALSQPQRCPPEDARTPDGDVWEAGDPR